MTQNFRYPQPNWGCMALLYALIFLPLTLVAQDFQLPIEFQGNAPICGNDNQLRDENDHFINLSEPLKDVALSLKASYMRSLSLGLEAYLYQAVSLGVSPQDPLFENILLNSMDRCDVRPELKKIVEDAYLEAQSKVPKQYNIQKLEAYGDQEITNQKQLKMNRLIIAVLEIARLRRLSEKFRRDGRDDILPEIGKLMEPIFRLYPQLNSISKNGKDIMYFAGRVERELTPYLPQKPLSDDLYHGYQSYKDMEKDPSERFIENVQEGTKDFSTYVLSGVTEISGFDQIKINYDTRFAELNSLMELKTSSSSNFYQTAYLKAFFQNLGNHEPIFSVTLQEELTELTKYATYLALHEFGNLCRYSDCETLEINLRATEHQYSQSIPEADWPNYQSEICSCKLQSRKQTISSSISTPLNFAGLAVGVPCIISFFPPAVPFAGPICIAAGVLGAAGAGVGLADLGDSRANTARDFQLANANNSISGSGGNGEVTAQDALVATRQYQNSQREKTINTALTALDVAGMFSGAIKGFKYIVGLEDSTQILTETRQRRPRTSGSKRFTPLQ
ncbi:MAG: hypothetical protein KDD22_03190, partial [Bdellovibrionales bacterium]|nr:hypothetical protein [Bdellovibrionales bacterium]